MMVMMVMMVMPAYLLTLARRRRALPLMRKRGVHMQRAVVLIRQCGKLDKLEDLIERFRHVRLFLIVQVQVQILQVRVRIRKIVLARISNVQNVGYTERLDDVRIAGVMPVTEVEATREDLVGVVVRRRGSCDERLPVRAKTEVLVIRRYLVEAADAEVQLS